MKLVLSVTGSDGGEFAVFRDHDDELLVVDIANGVELGRLDAHMHAAAAVTPSASAVEPRRPGRAA